MNRDHISDLPDHLSDSNQRAEMATLGMWIFLTTEVLFFGALFLAFTIYRHKYSADFVAASDHLNVWLGGLNTFILLTSSFFVALAVAAAHAGNRKRTNWHLCATVILAVIFLGIKAIEYHQDFTEKLIPGRHFNVSGTDSSAIAHQQLFFCFYFIMTGIHAFHMIAGTGVMAWMIMKNLRTKEDPMTQTDRIRVESIGLYWHFVDIVWVFLLPLLYLTGLERL
ncbi:cytochrome c oxidase subunit 3 [Luteolibacter pohnpeiensis]|uniref:Cytochrome c oxidase subunit 3 n=1 Tax=Luteolibacter pohnpeiensis TaxID=454153 RepID=A0A934S6C2_9BACT|nr:cytochrome c oxidase subunit 3 [Luteolibacter pohnpeiensis]MBK1882075.1 cytochrome c oxidase subunit 3 [Luteolibacter pohnpeiensis]